MASGKLVWDNKTQLKMEKDNLIVTGDTSLTFIDNGLHHLDLKSGEGFHEKMKMGLPFTGNAAPAAVFGGLLGGVFGAALLGAVAGTGNKAKVLVGNQHKNWIVDSSGIYLASQKRLAKFDFRGNTLWENPMPQKKGQ